MIYSIDDLIHRRKKGADIIIGSDIRAIIAEINNNENPKIEIIAIILKKV